MTLRSSTQLNIASARSWAASGVFVATLVLMSTSGGLARSGDVPPAQATAGLSVPTVKILAIGSFTAKAVPSLWKPMLPAEARAATRLYLEGKVDQWYVKQDNSGIVLMLNLTDPSEARKLVDRLPAAHQGLMEFQFTELGPLSPLRTLLVDPLK